MRKIFFPKLVLFVAFSVILLTLASCSSVKYETNEHELSEEFDSISIDIDTANVKIESSEDEKCRVICYEDEENNHTVEVKNNVLTISSPSDRDLSFNKISFIPPEITLYLPKNEYSSLNVENDTGNLEITESFSFDTIDVSSDTGEVNLQNITAKTINLSLDTGKATLTSITCEGDVEIDVSTGKVALTDLSCKNLSSEGNTGGLLLKGVIAKERLYAERDTGKIELDGSDASEIYISTGTGDVSGTLLTSKIFITKTDTGSVNVPSSTTGGRCEINTDTGDIKISIIGN